MKKVLFILTIMGTAVLYGASPDWRFHSVTFLGIEPTGWIREDDVKGDMLSTQFSGGQECSISLSPVLSCGGGIRFLSPRGNTDGEDFTFVPLYVSIRLGLPSKSLPFYLKGSAGYSLLAQDEGGLYYALGAGTQIPFYYSENFRYALDCGVAYSSCNGQTEAANEKIRVRYTSLDLSIGLGVSF